MAQCAIQHLRIEDFFPARRAAPDVKCLTSRRDSETMPKLSTSQSTSQAFAVGERVGQFDVLMPFVAGGMAQLYIARHTGLGNTARHVVLKSILPQFAGNPAAVAMFLDEAKVAAAMDHPNIARIFDFGHDRGRPYIAMEYVHGVDLRSLQRHVVEKRRVFPLPHAIGIVGQIAAGLRHAHHRCDPRGKPLQIVHRDISPANILCGYDGAVKIIDFGIAKAAERTSETQTGVIKGKAAYMSPEQVRGRPVDHRADLFALGIILYELATQERCFRANSDFDAMMAIAEGRFRKPSEVVPGFPVALETVILRALSVDPEARFADAQQLEQALAQIVLSPALARSAGAFDSFMYGIFGEVREPWVTLASPARSLAAVAAQAADVAPPERTDTDAMAQPLDAGVDLTLQADIAELVRIAQRKRNAAPSQPQFGGPGSGDVSRLPLPTASAAVGGAALRSSQAGLAQALAVGDETTPDIMRNRAVAMAHNAAHNGSGVGEAALEQAAAAGRDAFAGRRKRDASGQALPQISAAIASGQLVAPAALVFSPPLDASTRPAAPLAVGSEGAHGSEGPHEGAASWAQRNHHPAVRDVGAFVVAPCSASPLPSNPNTLANGDASAGAAANHGNRLAVGTSPVVGSARTGAPSQAPENLRLRSDSPAKPRATPRGASINELENERGPMVFALIAIGLLAVLALVLVLGW